MKAPIADSDDLEVLGDDGDATIRDMNATMDKIRERVAEDEDHADRSLHAKSRGLIASEVAIQTICRPNWPGASSRRRARMMRSFGSR